MVYYLMTSCEGNDKEWSRSLYSSVLAVLTEEPKFLINHENFTIDKVSPNDWIIEGTQEEIQVHIFPTKEEADEYAGLHLREYGSACYPILFEKWLRDRQG